jgi:hypothetical protein
MDPLHYGSNPISSSSNDLNLARSNSGNGISVVALNWAIVEARSLIHGQEIGQRRAQSHKAKRTAGLTTSDDHGVRELLRALIGDCVATLGWVPQPEACEAGVRQGSNQNLNVELFRRIVEWSNEYQTPLHDS